MSAPLRWSQSIYITLCWATVTCRLEVVSRRTWAKLTIKCTSNQCFPKRFPLFAIISVLFSWSVWHQFFVFSDAIKMKSNVTIDSRTLLAFGLTADRCRGRNKIPWVSFLVSPARTVNDISTRWQHSYPKYHPLNFGTTGEGCDMLWICIDISKVYWLAHMHSYTCDVLACTHVFVSDLWCGHLQSPRWLS